MTGPGIAVYGGAAVNGEPNPMKPVVKAEARILQVREARIGESVGYGASAVLSRDSRIAVAAIGYADGYLRSLSSAGVPLRQAVTTGAKGYLHGHHVPLIGRVTMDQMMVDVTGLPAAARVDDEVVLLGAQGEEFISATEIAQRAGTIAWHVFTGITDRVERVWG